MKRLSASLGWIPRWVVVLCGQNDYAIDAPIGAVQPHVIQQSCNGCFALASVVLERMTEGEELRVFATQANELVASDHLSGSMLVVRGSETVFEKGMGPGGSGTKHCCHHVADPMHDRTVWTASESWKQGSGTLQEVHPK